MRDAKKWVAPFTLVAIGATLAVVGPGWLVPSMRSMNGGGQVIIRPIAKRMNDSQRLEFVVAIENPMPSDATILGVDTPCGVPVDQSFPFRVQSRSAVEITIRVIPDLMRDCGKIMQFYSNIALVGNGILIFDESSKFGVTVAENR